MMEAIILHQELVVFLFKFIQLYQMMEQEFYTRVSKTDLLNFLIATFDIELPISISFARSPLVKVFIILDIEAL